MDAKIKSVGWTSAKLKSYLDWSLQKHLEDKGEYINVWPLVGYYDYGKNLQWKCINDIKMLPYQNYKNLQWKCINEMKMLPYQNYSSAQTVVNQSFLTKN